MTTADYMNAVDRTLSDDDPATDGLKGHPGPTPWGSSLSDALIRCSRAIYEEAVVEVLMADLRNHL